MDPLFIGNHIAVDFLNTSLQPDGEPIELLADGKTLLAWLQAAGVIDLDEGARLQRKLGAQGLTAAATEARKFREWVRGWLLRWRTAPNRDYAAEVTQLNRWMEKADVHDAVVRSDEGFVLHTRFRVDSIDALLGLLATHVAELITQEAPELLKSCAGSGCTLWFLDRTKAHRRQFCSAATCGNRAKVAAFRERQRE